MSGLNHTLYGCNGGLPPVWSDYDAVTWHPVREYGGADGRACCEPLLVEDKHLAQFWSVYIRHLDGAWEVITDVSTEKLAREIANAFSLEHDLVVKIRA